MPASYEQQRTLEELCDKILVLEAENQELTERSEELLLIGSLGEEMNSCTSESELIENTLERIGILKGVELVAYCDRTPSGFAVRHAYSANTHDCLTDFVVPKRLYDELSAPGVHLLMGPRCEGVHLRYGSARSPVIPHAILTLPIGTQNSVTSTLCLADTANDSNLPGALLALQRVADMLATHLDNFYLLAELRELNQSLDAVVDQRTAELRTANRQLHESEERFRGLVAAAGDAIFVVNALAHITDANPQACRSLGYDMNELLGKSLFEIEVSTNEAEFRGLQKTLTALPVQSPALTRQGTHRRQDGSTFPVEIRVSPLTPLNSSEPAVMILARDISERQRLELQLQQSQKMESIGRFAGGIAHDFNNLLTAILGYSEILLSDESGDVRNQEELLQIRAAGTRAAALTQQLLAFSRRQVLARRNVDLGPVVKDGCQMLRRIIGDDIIVELRIEPAPTAVFADAVQLHQVLLNLAVNARDAMPQGGKLVIDVARATVDETTAALQSELHVGDYVVLTVADSGAGMSPEVKAHLFEPFFTTKPVGQGTGLGLATVYGIVRQHGGYVAVYSAPGQGTTFRVFFPASAAIAAEKAPTPLLDQPLRGTERVLVVDDSDVIRSFLYDGLSRLGYRVVLAGQGQEALDTIATADAEPFALVLSDVVMPVMNGPDFVARVTEKHPALPIVLMSGFLDDQVGTTASLRQGIKIVQKPISLLELSYVLRTALTGTAKQDSRATTEST